MVGTFGSFIRVGNIDEDGSGNQLLGSCFSSMRRFDKPDTTIGYHDEC